jgi:hypothetical protein
MIPFAAPPEERKWWSPPLITSRIRRKAMPQYRNDGGASGSENSALEMALDQVKELSSEKPV